MLPFYVQGISVGSTLFVGFVGISELYSKPAVVDSNARNVVVIPSSQYCLMVAPLLISKVIVTATTIFTNRNEGTYLRRNLLLAIGACDLFLAFGFYRTDPKSTAKVMCYVLAIEGITFLKDAIFRRRVLKNMPSSSKN